MSCWPTPIRVNRLEASHLTRGTRMSLKVGILGAGQLGRMLALAGYPLGLSFRFFEPGDGAPCRGLGEIVHGDWSDRAALDRFADGLSVATFEFENIPVAAVEHVASRVRVFPGSAALATGQDRLAEKQLFDSLGIPAAPWRAVATRDELGAAYDALGGRCILKTRRLGYDGKGQAPVDGRADLDSAWSAVAGAPSLLEQRVPFEYEVSVLGVRGVDGKIATYPLTKNTHESGILRRSIAPAPRATADLHAAAVAHVTAVLERLQYVGVLAIEFFVEAGGGGGAGDGGSAAPARLVANEIAPRVHNSGHWTIDGAQTSQFENHLRAICGLPLGPVGMRSPAAGMVNLIGSWPSPAAIVSLPTAKLHLYAKAPRPGRKVGHVNVTGGDWPHIAAELDAIERICRGAERTV